MQEEIQTQAGWAIAAAVFAAPISLGMVSNLEREVSAAPGHRDALAAVRKAEVKFADETSWEHWGKLCWLWAAVTTDVAVTVIHAHRGARGLTALPGDDIAGIVHSDRWSAPIRSSSSATRSMDVGSGQARPGLINLW